MDRLLHHDLEVIPVFRQQREREVVRDAAHAPRLRDGLEAAHQQAADFLAHVDVAVGIAQHRQVRRHAGHRLGDDVEVLGGVQRHRDAGEPSELARPHPRAVHDDVARDVARRRAHARDGAVADVDAGDRGVLEDRRAAEPRALREGERGVDRIRASVARQPEPAHEIVGADERPAPARFLRRDHFHLDAEAARHRREALQLVHALGGAREAHAAGTAEARRLPRLRFERLVEVGAVLRELRQVLRRAELADEPGRVPRGAAGDVATLEEHDVAPAELRQVIRDAAAGDPAADHDDTRVGRRGTHASLRPALFTRRIAAASTRRCAAALSPAVNRARASGGDTQTGARRGSPDDRCRVTSTRYASTSCLVPFRPFT